MIGAWLAAIPGPVFVAICVLAVVGAFAAFAWYSGRQAARIQADIDQALDLVRPRPVWRMLPCGCTWMSGDGSKRDQPVVIICAGHWIDAYEACDYFYFEREIST